MPFYFTPFSIMMYNIHTGYNVPRVPNEQIVILVSSLFRISDLGIAFVFTDQHAFLKTANYFTRLEDLARVDWALLNSKNFSHDPDDPGKKIAIKLKLLSGSMYRLRHCLESAVTPLRLILG